MCQNERKDMSIDVNTDGMELSGKLLLKLSRRGIVDCFSPIPRISSYSFCFASASIPTSAPCLFLFSSFPSHRLCLLSLATHLKCPFPVYIILFFLLLSTFHTYLHPLCLSYSFVYRSPLLLNLRPITTQPHPPP